MKKILLVITKSNWGGAQKYVHTLAVHAHEVSDFHVEVITGNRGELNERLKESGIKERSIALKNSLDPFVFLGEVVNVLGILKEGQPDIVHANSNKAGVVYGFAVALYNLTHKKKIRSLFTVHGHAYNEDRNVLARFYITLAELIVFMLVDRIISVSQKTFKDIPFREFFKRKTSIIYNGLPELSYFTKEGARAKLGIVDTDVRHIVTIAELSDTKNHLYLLRALARFGKPFHYHIIGAGSTESHIRDFIHKHNLENKVTLHGHVVDACTYLKAFDLFVLPSKTEALAYVIQEACQAGIPVIASRVGGLPELLPEENLFSLDRSQELNHLLRNMETISPHPHYFKEADMLDQTFALYRK